VIVRLVGVFIVLCGLMQTTANMARVPAVAAQAPPNFVTIIVDDLDAASVAKMPAVNELLTAEGATFTHFFAPTPLCCPSRVSMLRGQYAHNHGVLRNTGEDAGFAAFLASGEESETLATVLQDGGYKTGLIGKYLNGYVSVDDPRIPVPQTYVPPGWDTWISGVDHAAYTNFDYTLNVNGSLVGHGHEEGDYLTDVLSDYAVDFIDNAVGDGQAFFLYLNPYSPHQPTVPAPRHEGMFRGAMAPRTPAFDEADVEDKPEWIRTAARLNERKLTRIDEGYQVRLEALQAVDEMVRALVNKLVEDNLLDSTYILFLSDNGYFLGEYRQPNGKDAPYDAATRIPLIIRGPGVAANSEIDQIAMNIDLLPTLAQLANVSAPSFVDGRSLVPLWSETKPAWRQIALFEGFGREFETVERAEKEAPAFNALRTADTLYAEYETGEREYYDLVADPFHLTNIADEVPEETLSLYSERLAALAACERDECRSLEDAPVVPGS
jgi:N-acetylglucosamine-6-sulfatase